MTDERLTDELAVRVLGWKPSPDRYLQGGKKWTPRWRFRPLADVSDALQLLDHAANRYTLHREGGVFTVEVTIDHHSATQSGTFLARTVTLAVAQAVGLEVDR